MAFAPSVSWNSPSITHLASYPSRSLPTNSSDEPFSPHPQTGKKGASNPDDANFSAAKSHDRRRSFAVRSDDAGGFDGPKPRNGPTGQRGRSGSARHTARRHVPEPHQLDRQRNRTRWRRRRSTHGDRLIRHGAWIRQVGVHGNRTSHGLRRHTTAGVLDCPRHWWSYLDPLSAGATGRPRRACQFSFGTNDYGPSSTNHGLRESDA